MRLAFAGGAGSFSEAAARQALERTGDPEGPVTDGSLIEVASFAAVLTAVMDGRAERGVIPIHNNLAGPVPGADALLAARPGLEVERWIALPVRLCVLGRPGVALDSIQEVRSHPHALRQAGELLMVRGWVAMASRSTAEAAKEVASGALGDTTAALASHDASQGHGLAVLLDDVAPGSETRFAVVRRKDSSTA